MTTNRPPLPPVLSPESDDQLGRPSRGTWLMIAMLVIVKVGTLAIVFMVDFSKMAAMFAIVSTWIWIVVLAVLLSGPTMFAYRIRRVRSRKAALQRSEWVVE